MRTTRPCSARSGAQELATIKPAEAGQRNYLYEAARDKARWSEVRRLATLADWLDAVATLSGEGDGQVRTRWTFPGGWPLAVEVVAADSRLERVARSSLTSGSFIELSPNLALYGNVTVAHSFDAKARGELTSLLRAAFESGRTDGAECRIEISSGESSVTVVIEFDGLTWPDRNWTQAKAKSTEVN